MEAKELRFGNCVNHSEHLFVVSWTLLRDMALETPTSNYEPILITEEWLLNLGFEETYRSKFTLRFDYEPNTKFGAGWNLLTGTFTARFIGEDFTHIRFVHQLQNLYFALTGEELIIKSLSVGKK